MHHAGASDCCQKLFFHGLENFDLVDVHLLDAAAHGFLENGSFRPGVEHLRNQSGLLCLVYEVLFQVIFMEFQDMRPWATARSTEPT